MRNGLRNPRYKLLTRKNTVTATADADGSLWVVVGTESGFEATTTLFYKSISVTLTPK